MEDESKGHGVLSNEWVVEVTDETFESDVVVRSKEVPVVVDFWAEWCGPCRILGPILEKLALEYAGKFVLAKVDTDGAPHISQSFGIRSIPTVFAFKDGVPGESFAGALPEQDVRNFIDRLVPSQEDDLATRADQLRATDPEGAIGLYREVLQATPGNDAARLGLAEVLLEQGEREDAKATIAPMMPPSGPLADRAEHVRSELALDELTTDRSEDELRGLLEAEPERADLLLELGQLLAAGRRYPEALEALLDASRRDRALASGAAKKLMVDIFHVVGVRSELADDYRTKLTRLLY